MLSGRDSSSTSRPQQPSGLPKRNSDGDLAAGDTADVTVVELRDIAHDIPNRLLTGFASPPLQQALDSVAGADGLIAVSPLYSASYSGLFKSFFDVLDPDALTSMPVIIGSTGGTARHSLALEHALRPLFTYLREVARPDGGLRCIARLGRRIGRRHLAV